MNTVERIIADLVKGASSAAVEYHPDRGREVKLASVGKLSCALEEGRQAALVRYKAAFLGAIAPLAGAVAGPALARGALGKLAPAAAQGLGQGFKGMLFDSAASLGGQMLGAKMTGQPAG